MKHVLTTLLLSLAIANLAGCAQSARWNASWTAPPDSPGPALQAQTIRQVVRTSIGGSTLRIRLSNLYGKTPLTVGPVHLALHEEGVRVQAGSDHPLRFGGAGTVTIGAGDSVLSDPVEMAVPALAKLAVSIYLPQPVPVSTLHGTGMQTAFLSTAGDLTAVPAFEVGRKDDSRYFLTDVEVMPAGPARTLVVLGDSIADGVGSDNDHDARWPDLLATRLQADPGHASIAVVNAGIAGNRVLNDGVDPFVGPSALSRLDRDALDKPGVHWILLHEGINDIAASQMLQAAGQQVSVEQIIAGMKTLVARARDKKVAVWAGTLLPFEGTKGFYSAQAENARQALNAWIRSAGAFDGVVDFDLLMRDPAYPGRLRADVDSGDHLHPNEAGYKAMADAVGVKMLALP